jgi:uncharacterized protein (TIGR02147 family)
VPSIFDYFQYREFLKDYYQEQKKRKSGFTYARFSEKARLGSPNYYKLVMDGEKNLTSANVIRFCHGLGFGAEESDYFEALVNFNQADEAMEREYYQERLNRLRTRRGNGEVSQRTLEEYEFEAMSSWVHHAIMLLTNVRGFRESPVWIKRRLFDLVSEEEVLRILEHLQAIRLLERDENGKLRQTHRQIKTRPDLKRQAARSFYEGIFSRASQTFKLDGPEARELGVEMASFSKKQLPELRKRVREFLASLNEWALSNPEPEQIYAFVFGGFPLSQDEEKDVRAVPGRAGQVVWQ